MQDKVYIGLPPGVKLGISLKRPETTQMGYFWSPLDSKSQDLTTTKNEPGTLITQHTAQIAYEFDVL